LHQIDGGSDRRRLNCPCHPDDSAGLDALQQFGVTGEPFPGFGDFGYRAHSRLALVVRLVRNFLNMSASSSGVLISIMAPSWSIPWAFFAFTKNWARGIAFTRCLPTYHDSSVQVHRGERQSRHVM
jgi:hypothetical protein